MTFIQPTKHLNFLNIVLAVIVCALLAGTFWLVVAYNKTVDLNGNIVSAKSQLDAIGVQSTALNNNIIAMLGGGQITGLAARDNLVLEKKPQYFPIDQKWSIASQQ